VASAGVPAMSLLRRLVAGVIRLTAAAIMLVGMVVAIPPLLFYYVGQALWEVAGEWESEQS
jgi:hypothetical protein